MYVIGDKQMSDKEAEDFATDFGSDVNFSRAKRVGIH